MAWNPKRIPEQSGRTFVVTGANGGLGAVTTKVLAAKGATVVMACRNVAKAEQIAATIPGDVRVEPLDLADLSSVRAFADNTAEFDVLVNNAGIMYVPFSRTADGFETQFGFNHLGHFAITSLLHIYVRAREVSMMIIC